MALRQSLIACCLDDSSGAVVGCGGCDVIGCGYYDAGGVGADQAVVVGMLLFHL